MAAQLPERIKIGGHWWSVKSGGDEDIRLKDENTYGETDERNFAISIDSRRPGERQAESLLHEVLHAVECTWLTPKDRSMESVVKANTAGLLQVLRDNPEVVTFIMGGQDGKEDSGQGKGCSG